MIAVVRGNISRMWQSGRMHVVAAYATVNLVSAVTGILIARSAGTIRYGGYAILASQAALAGSLIPLGSPLHILRSADRDEVDRAVRAAVVLTAISAAISLPLLGIAFRIPAAGLIATGCTAVAALTSAMLPRTRGPRRAAAAQAAGAVALLAAVVLLYTFDALTPHRLLVVSGVAALAAPFVYRAVRDD